MRLVAATHNRRWLTDFDGTGRPGGVDRGYAAPIALTS